ncbi:hypothetical protein KUCAC02_013331 [Chaenocephalus aceratus]|nr:hypothetical protein KUCAC02_013331 [Chaenocephalus aceratus]
MEWRRLQKREEPRMWAEGAEMEDGGQQPGVEVTEAIVEAGGEIVEVIVGEKEEGDGGDGGKAKRKKVRSEEGEARTGAAADPRRE